MQKRKDLLWLLFKILVTSTIFVLVLLHFDTLKNLDVRALVTSASSTATAIGTVFGVYCLKGIVFVIPAMLIYVSVGMVFSPLMAVLLNLVGLLLELIVSYLFGLFLGGDKIRAFLFSKKGGKKILEMQSGKKYTSIFLMRLLPAFPIDFVSLFLGSTKEKFLPYLLFSFLGVAPRVIVLTLLGDKIYDLIPMRLIVIAILVFVVVFAIVAVVQYILKKKKQRITKVSEEKDAK